MVVVLIPCRLPARALLTAALISTAVAARQYARPAAVVGTATPDPSSSIAIQQQSSLLTGQERTTWYFAEGSCAATDHETLAFLNPGPRRSLVLTTLIRSDGHRLGVVTDVDPRSRGSLDASFSAGSGDLLAAIVHSSEPIVAERAVYHGSRVEEGTGAALVSASVPPLISGTYHVCRCRRIPRSG